MVLTVMKTLRNTLSSYVVLLPFFITYCILLKYEMEAWTDLPIQQSECYLTGGWILHKVTWLGEFVSSGSCNLELFHSFGHSLHTTSNVEISCSLPRSTRIRYYYNIKDIKSICADFPIFLKNIIWVYLIIVD
jgi:hypothetical protein